MPDILPAWDITLNVYGPITVERRFNFRQRKVFHFHDRLYSDIEVTKNGNYGITITLTAFASEQADLIENSKIDHWIFGHHHYNRADFSIGKTIMHTNQLGYVKYGENQGYSDCKHITV